MPFVYCVPHFYLLCMLLYAPIGHALSETTPNVIGIMLNYPITGEG